MAVRALLLAVLLIEINSSIQVDDSDIARETAISSSKNPRKLQKQFSYNFTRSHQNMLLWGNSDKNLTKEISSLREIYTTNVRDMIESWSWNIRYKGRDDVAHQSYAIVDYTDGPDMVVILWDQITVTV